MLVQRGRVQLFNIKEDPTESSDLAKAEPQRAERMLAQWEKWNESNQPPFWPSGVSQETGCRKTRGSTRTTNGSKGLRTTRPQANSRWISTFSCFVGRFAGILRLSVCIRDAVFKADRCIRSGDKRLTQHARGSRHSIFRCHRRVLKRCLSTIHAVDWFCDGRNVVRFVPGFSKIGSRPAASG